MMQAAHHRERAIMTKLSMLGIIGGALLLTAIDSADAQVIGFGLYSGYGYPAYSYGGYGYGGYGGYGGYRSPAYSYSGYRYPAYSYRRHRHPAYCLGGDRPAPSGGGASRRC